VWRCILVFALHVPSERTAVSDRHALRLDSVRLRARSLRKSGARQHSARERVWNTSQAPSRWSRYSRRSSCAATFSRTFRYRCEHGLVPLFVVRDALPWLGADARADTRRRGARVSFRTRSTSRTRSCSRGWQVLARLGLVRTGASRCSSASGWHSQCTISSKACAELRRRLQSRVPVARPVAKADWRGT